MEDLRSPTRGDPAQFGAPLPDPSSGRLMRIAFAVVAVWVAILLAGESARAVHGGGGGDFWAFWAAGRAAVHGLDPYSRAVLLGTPIPAPMTRTRFLSPPFFAQIMRPFGLLPFRLAYALWTGASLAALLYAVMALMDMCRLRRTPANLCVAAVLLVSFAPSIATLTLGQTDALVLASLCASWRLRRDGRPFAAGLAVCAAAVDPQLAVAFGLLHIVRGWADRDRRLLGGMAVGGAIAVALSLLHPVQAVQWLRSLPGAEGAVLDMNNEVTTVRLLHALMPHASLSAAAGVGLLDVVALAAALRVWARPLGPVGDEGAMAAATALALGTAGFAFLQDELLLMLAVPFAVAAWRGRSSARWPWMLGGGGLMLAFVALDAVPLGPVTGATIVGTPLAAVAPPASLALAPFLALAMLAIRAAADAAQAWRVPGAPTRPTTTPRTWVGPVVMGLLATLVAAEVALLTFRSGSTLLAVGAAMVGLAALLVAGGGTRPAAAAPAVDRPGGEEQPVAGRAWRAM